MDRFDIFLEHLRSELTSGEIVAGLQNGDIEKPEWLSIAESTDHIKIWDNESYASSQLGFTILTSDDDND